MVRPDNIIVKM